VYHNLQHYEIQHLVNMDGFDKELRVVMNRDKKLKLTGQARQAL